MKITIEIDPYDPVNGGLRTRFRGGGRLKIKAFGEDGFALEGDKVGFADLAHALLAMVHSGVPEDGLQHIHIDETPILAKGSSSIVVQWLHDWDGD